jgi:Domain of unknown function (DUF5655)/Domain of unknown function (DUF4287)
MADPQAATLTQLRNIQVKTGRSIAQLHAALADSGLGKTGERRSWLMAQFKLGYGDANALALLYGKPLPALDMAVPADLAPSPPDGDALAALYTGPKAALRPLHEAVIALVSGFGPFEEAPKKAYVSLRRKKQFAMLGPATQSQIEIGINHKDLPAHPRLKRLPAGGMCQASLRIARVDEIDADLADWLRQAYAAAG